MIEITVSLGLPRTHQNLEVAIQTRSFRLQAHTPARLAIINEMTPARLTRPASRRTKPRGLETFAHGSKCLRQCWHMRYCFEYLETWWHLGWWNTPFPFSLTYKMSRSSRGRLASALLEHERPGLVVVLRLGLVVLVRFGLVVLVHGPELVCVPRPSRPKARDKLLSTASSTDVSMHAANPSGTRSPSKAFSMAAQTACSTSSFTGLVTMALAKQTRSTKCSGSERKLATKRLRASSRA